MTDDAEIDRWLSRVRVILDERWRWASTPDAVMNRLSDAVALIDRLRAENARLKADLLSAAERIAGQSEALARAAERKHQ